MRTIVYVLVCAALALGCNAPKTELLPIKTREAENVPPEMLDRALQGLHSEEPKLQISGLRFLESFPELKQQHLVRIEELATNGKDAKVRSQAAKILN